MGQRASRGTADKTSKRLLLRVVFGVATTVASHAWAEQHTAGVPQLSSRPGAAYTIYLDMAGFNYSGAWSSYTPGNTPAVNDVAATGTFSATEQLQLKAIWQRVAQCYIPFNVNVTTVDPATGVNAATDAARLAFYDATPNFMHTVIGSGLRSGTSWVPGADGISGINVVTGTGLAKGDHTNWMLTEAQAGAATGGVIRGEYIGEVAAHENAHAFSLYHQSDYTGSTLKSEYAFGDSFTGNGSYVPIIGQADGRQRVTWRSGDTHVTGRVVTNDIQAMLANDTAAKATLAGKTGGADLHLVDDGVGHTRLTATPLPLNGTAVDFNLAKGVIVPTSEANPNPIGAANYTQDWFSFTTLGNPITLNAYNGTEFLTPGVADGVGTLRSTLTIFDAFGVQVGVGIENANTLFETYTGTLAAGTYFAQIASFGGHAQVNASYNAASYFDTGAFFLTGSGFAVPEPAGLALVLIGVAGVLRRRRR